MKNSGFTLIELLAVIVILAIIALIATPIILNIINDSKEESEKRSIELYAKAVQNAVADYQLNHENENVSGFFISTEGKKGRQLTKDQINLTVEYDGNVECKKIKIYKKGNVYLDECKVNNKSVEYTYGELVYKVYKNGEEVYFDVSNGKACSANKVVSTTGTKSGCMKFYAFNDGGKQTESIELLLDHNTTTGIAGASSAVSSSIPNTALNQLKADTSSWKNTIEPTNYSGAYTINYSGYKARLLEMEDIIKITNTNSIPTGFYYYFDSKAASASDTCKSGVTTGCGYGWLYDRTNSACTTYGCLNNAEVSEVYKYGYWTATRNSSDYRGGIWAVNNQGSATTVSYSNTGYGIRPVIKVLKDNL